MNDARYIANRLFTELSTGGDRYVLSREQVQQIVDLLDGRDPHAESALQSRRKCREEVRQLKESYESTIDALKEKISELEDDLKPFREIGEPDDIRVITSAF